LYELRLVFLSSRGEGKQGEEKREGGGFGDVVEIFLGAQEIGDHVLLGAAAEEAGDCFVVARDGENADFWRAKAATKRRVEKWAI